MKRIFTNTKVTLKKTKLYYGPSVINITVTKGEHLRGSRLYKTNRTIGRGVSQVI